MDGINTISDLIDLHIADMVEVGKEIGRSKGFSLDLLRARLGKLNISDLNREQIIKFGKERAEDGAGPVTVGIDIGYIRTLLVHGAAVHGLPYSAGPVELGRVALVRLGLVGKGNERDRRPTDDEIEALVRYFRGEWVDAARLLSKLPCQKPTRLQAAPPFSHSGSRLTEPAFGAAYKNFELFLTSAGLPAQSTHWSVRAGACLPR
jgi:hypothetical protein